ncbi:MAG TPA: family 78 glycoside hydrolase catalytic domain [Balneolaceae bacterium]|nr:family 78 glycoside hydrolase catalytic domain [Balneolaceae bacterium]
MKYIYVAVFILFLPLHAWSQALHITHLRCEHDKNPRGIDQQIPHLSWQLQSDQKDVVQSAYRVLVATNPKDLAKNNGNIWDSGKVASDSSIQIPYGGKTLRSTRTYYWKVKVWDNKGNARWSKVRSWQMGLLTRSSWRGAQWIAYHKLPKDKIILPGDHYNKKKARNDTLPLLRRSFNLRTPVKKATIFISGLGQFNLYMNGKKVSKDFLDPAWTQYNKEAVYKTFDVTRQLQQGQNAIGVMLGNGFYYIPSGNTPKRYRKLTVAYGHPKMICRLKITFTDGSVKNIISNGQWKTARSPIIYSNEYGGEDYNANLKQPGWDAPGFDASGWRKPAITSGPPHLHAQIEDPIRFFNHFHPQKVQKIKPGTWVYDMGQNCSAIPNITVKGQQGDTVKIVPGEVTSKDGTVSQKGSGGPSFFRYILDGKGTESWHPRFSYYGFRYLQVEGAVPAGKPNPRHLPVVKQIQSWHFRNATTHAGHFSSSNKLFNKIYKLIDWAIQSNMVSLFTDCPHREKLGWLEQDHLMGNSIHYDYHIANIFRRIIKDMQAAQHPNGLVPEIAPEYAHFTGAFLDSPEWGSSSVIVPWYTYRWYGDQRVLDRSYPMMKQYVKYLTSRAKNHILYFGLSDWYDIGPKRPGVSQLTPKGVTATATYYYDLNIMHRVATMLHKPNDAAHYKQLAGKVKASFNNKFFHKDTKEYATGSQAANAMAVYMHLVNPKYKKAVVDNIVKNVQKKHLTAGDIGYRYLLKVLDDNGRANVIYKLNNRSDIPGYGYQIAHGATALTESWQAYPSSSNDHLMLGHLMEWLYDGLGGIRQAKHSVAFHHIKIAPEPVGNLHWVHARFQSPYGLIRSRWKKAHQTFSLQVHIPANTTATIYLPAGQNQKITEEGKVLQDQKNVKKAGYKNGKAIVNVGSGTYHFRVQ